MEKKLWVPLAVLGTGIAIVLAVMFRGSIGPVGPLTAGQQQALQLRAAARDACLVGSDLNGGLDASTGIEDWGAKLDVEITSKDAQGAVGYIDEQIRSIQDDRIRECLSPWYAQIKACLLGDCERPSEIDIEFSLAFAAPDDPSLHPREVMMGMRGRIKDRPLTPGSDGFYARTVAFPASDERIDAKVSRRSRDGFRTARDPAARFCLAQAAAVPGRAQTSFTQLECAEGETCRFTDRDPGLLGFCPPEEQDRTGWLFPLVGTAHADVERGIWRVPSLETLEQRASVDLEGAGFTVFELSTERPPPEADAVSYAIGVNDVAVRIDGLDSEYALEPVVRGEPMRIRFGLQNLNFVGRQQGCDTISLEIRYWSRGRPLGEPDRLSRSYVAMRDARPREIGSSGDPPRPYRWTGTYVKPLHEWDHEVFVGATTPRGTPTPELVRSLSTERRDIERHREAFDALNLEFQGHPLVGVVRPPYRKASYGVAVGQRQASGQIRFTYLREEATALERRLMEVVASNPDAASVIPNDLRAYPIRPTEGPPPMVCADELGLEDPGT